MDLRQYVNTVALAGGVLAATPALGPPHEPGPFRPADLVEVATLEPSVHVDVRYATKNNFVGRPVYNVARVFLQRPAAEALVRAHTRLHEQGYGLLLFDGYRPWSVTKLFWEVTPPEKHTFVADPSVGSRHNRGCAVDLTLYDLASDREVEMPSPYDEMSERAAPDYKGGSAPQRTARDRLRTAMEAQGFTVDSGEWWHYNYKDWRAYPILDESFEALVSRAGAPR